MHQVQPKTQKNSKRSVALKGRTHYKPYLNNNQKWEQAMEYFENHPDTLLKIIPDRIEIHTPALSNKHRGFNDVIYKQSRKNSKKREHVILASNSPIRDTQLKPKSSKRRRHKNKIIKIGNTSASISPSPQPRTQM